MSGSNNSELAELMEEQIAATNRATRAVRAIVIPSTIVLVTVLISMPIFVFGLLSDDFSGALILAGLVLLAGGIFAIFTQIEESRLSEIPAGRFGAAPSGAADGTASSSAEDSKKEDLLSASQRSDWVMAGKPGLSTWDGQQSFSDWLKRNR
jgi:hypothetical protein